MVESLKFPFFLVWEKKQIKYNETEIMKHHIKNLKSVKKFLKAQKTMWHKQQT